MLLFRKHLLRADNIKYCSLEVHSYITHSLNESVYHDVMFAVCLASTHLILLLFSVTLSVSAVMDVS